MTDRIGYPAQPVIWQGARPHGSVYVGRGAQTFGHVGCLVTATAMALRFLGVRAGASPLDVQDAGLARPGVWADGSSGAVVPELVRAQPGLMVSDDFSGAGTSTPAPRLRAEILRCLEDGGVALVCVDYDRDLPTGDPTGEHWCCARAVEGDRLCLADPATAKDESVDLATLSGPVRWGSVVRPYVVVRAVTVFRR